MDKPDATEFVEPSDNELASLPEASFRYIHQLSEAYDESQIKNTQLQEQVEKLEWICKRREKYIGILKAREQALKNEKKARKTLDKRGR